MKKATVVGVILVLCVNLIAYTGALEDGVKLLNFAKKARVMGNEADEKEYLERAYKAFLEADDDTSRILRIYTGHLLNRDADTKDTAVALIKSRRGTYRDIISALDMIEPREKDLITTYLSSIEARIPFVDDVSLDSTSFFPYQGQRPWLGFNLNCGAKVTLVANAARDQEEVFPAGGTYRFQIGWKDSYLGNDSLSLELSSKNDFSEDEVFSVVKSSIHMPEGLQYASPRFSVTGKDFLEETRIKYRRKIGTTGFISMAIGALSVIGGVVYLTSDVTGVPDGRLPILGGATLMIWPLIFREKSKKSYTVRLKKNEAYNKSLLQEIEAMKKQILVDLEKDK